MIKHALTIFAVSLLAAATPSFAADSMADAGRTLPPICTAGAMNMGAMKSGSSMGGQAMPMDSAHQDLMKGMDQMNSNMMQGMTASDIDVAFVCGMIPHHQGAIDMAKAELAHGKDAFTRKLATNIIAAQEKEIGEMLAWLKKQK